MKAILSFLFFLLFSSFLIYGSQNVSDNNKYFYLKQNDGSKLEIFNKNNSSYPTTFVTAGDLFFCDNIDKPCNSLCQIIDYLNYLNDENIFATIYLLNNYYHKENCNPLLIPNNILIDGKNNNFLFYTQPSSELQTNGSIAFNDVILYISSSSALFTCNELQLSNCNVTLIKLQNTVTIKIENTTIESTLIYNFNSLILSNVTFLSQRSVFYEGNNLEFKDCKFLASSLVLQFIDKLYFNHIETNGKQFNELYTFTIVNCKDIKIAWSVFYNSSFEIIKSLKITMNNVISDNGYFDIWISNGISIYNSKFLNSLLYGLRVTDVDAFFIHYCDFYNNRDPMVISNNYITFIKLVISNCKFENNYSLQSGGAISILGRSIGISTLFIENVKFTKNIAVHNGGAIYIDSPMEIVTIQNSEFSYNKIENKNNTKQQQQQTIVTRNEIGNGGAIFFSLIKNPVQFNNITAFNNSAVRGGVIFTTISLEFMDSLQYNFYNNEANCGGILFSNDLHTLQKIKKLNNIMNNVGIYYGNEVASFASFINFTIIVNNKVIDNINDLIEIYPGQEFIIEITMFDLIGQEIKLLNEPFTKSDCLSDNYKLETINSVNNIYKFIILQKIDKLNNLENTKNCNQIKFNTLFTERHINIIVKDCPDNFIKYQQYDNYFICKKKEFPILVIIIISSVTSSFLSLCFFLLFTYCCINITKKLRKLKQKENAEKDMERKILDNQVVFGEESSTTKTDNNTPLLKSNYQKDYNTIDNYNSINNVINDLPKKKKLLKSSFIIPVEQIKLERKIGEGGGGTVYLATWGSNKVAIKSIKLTTNEDDSSVEDFEREVTLLSKLRHPNIVTFYGVTITESSKYMVIEYLSKGTLKQAIYYSKIGKDILNLEKKINILIGIAEGINYLHNLKPNPILHRDLKSDNILLDQFGNCKVCDFGLSKIVGNSTMTTNVGTLFYLAPEMLNTNDNSLNITSKLDVYSYSIIMWELFFEEVPYTKNSKKLNYFLQNNNKELQIIDNLFIIPSLVLKGLRPVIPFSNVKEKEIWVNEFILPFESNKTFYRLQECIDRYLELMTNCWNESPQNRPSFNEIANQLIDMKNLITDIHR